MAAAIQKGHTEVTCPLLDLAEGLGLVQVQPIAPATRTADTFPFLDHEYLADQ